jgi:hypothetical protein
MAGFVLFVCPALLATKSAKSSQRAKPYLKEKERWR